jgi:DNA-binding PadR family transcriptional regulator
MAKKSSAHTLEYILLGLIREEPAHGYALYEKLRSTSELSLIWQVKRSKLYYLLDKLETDELLVSSITSQSPYPDRKVYQITNRGNEILDKWMYSPVLSSRYVRLAFLSKLYFVLRQNRDLAADLITKQVDVCQGWLDNLERQYKKLENTEYINSQVFLFRIGQIKAMIEWLKNLRETIPV